jgi:type I restriction enzyme S subunit
MARALFKSWFIDFDPVRRNMERRRGKSLPAAGGMAELDAIFPDSFVDSELGRIPKGWRGGTVGESFRHQGPIATGVNL